MKAKIIMVFITGILTVCTFSCKKDSSSAPGPVNKKDSTYYVDAVSGNDANSGTDPDEAWKTVDKVSKSRFKPGTKICFKSGQTFKGILNISSSGDKQYPIIYTTYGGNNKATIAGEGSAEATVSLENKEYIEFRHLKITNHLANNSPETGKRLLGIHVLNRDFGTLSHIHFISCEVSDVNGEYESFDSRYYGGVLIEVKGKKTPSNYDDILVENCLFENISRTGFNFNSSWALRNSDTNYGDPLGDGRTDNWFPSTNIVIRNNQFKNISGNGLIVRVAKDALIEGNLFDKNGKDISGNAVFCFNTDHTVIQYNEAKNTVYNSGDTDASGIDSDFRTKNTIIQYNYLHDNGIAGVVATGGNEEGKVPERFNINTIIRYNIIENNKRRGTYFSGNLYNAYVYNNVIYNDPTNDPVKIVYFNKWSMWPHDVRFANNIINVRSTHAEYDIGSSYNISFTHNVYYGPDAANLPISKNPKDIPGVVKDSFYVLTDPKLSNPGSGEEGYHLLPGSSAIGAGITEAEEEQPSKDYYGNPITAPLNIGIFQGTP